MCKPTFQRQPGGLASRRPFNFNNPRFPRLDDDAWVVVGLVNCTAYVRCRVGRFDDRRQRWKRSEGQSLELPLFCLCDATREPTDFQFIMKAMDIEKEMEIACRSNEMTHVQFCKLLDELVDAQITSNMFPTMDTILRVAIMLQNGAVRLLRVAKQFEQRRTVQRLSNNGFTLNNTCAAWFFDRVAETVAKIDRPHDASRTWRMVSSLVDSETGMMVFLTIDLREVRKLLDSAVDAQSYKELCDFVNDFCESSLSSIEWQMLYARHTGSMSDLRTSMLVGILSRRFTSGEDMTKGHQSIIAKTVQLVVENGWSMTDVGPLVDLRSEAELSTWDQVLDVFYTYRLSPVGINRVTEGPMPEWILNAHRMALQQCFLEDSRLLNLEEIVQKVAASSAENAEFFQGGPMTAVDLRRMMNDDGDELHIRVTAAVAAVNKYFGVKLRAVQVMSVMLATKSRDDDQGLVLQIQTGEGKTYIVAAIAVAEVMRGGKVDILTSSPELAMISFEQMKPFLEGLGMTADYNIGGNVEIKSWNNDQKQVYEADIVYGNTLRFIGDVLSAEFSEKDYRHERGFPFLIVDEVDNMLLDGLTAFVYLSSDTPGMNDVVHVLAFIWSIVEQTHQQLEVDESGQWFIKEGGQLVPLGESGHKLCRRVALQAVRKVLRLDPLEESDEETAPELEVPPFVKTLVEAKLTSWVYNAVYAKFDLKLGFHYVLHKEKSYSKEYDDPSTKIGIVDFSNTGSLQHRMHWINGLHQFLQLKHGCRVVTEMGP